MKKILLLILLLSLTSTVSADAAVSWFTAIYGISATIFLIPIILVEAFALIHHNKLFQLNVGLKKAVWISFVTNTFSTFLGLLLSLFTPLGYLGASKNPAEIIKLLFLAYIITTIIEAPVISLYIKEKTKSHKPLMISALLNIYSYGLLLMGIPLLYHT